MATKKILPGFWYEDNNSDTQIKITKDHFFLGEWKVVTKTEKKGEVSPYHDKNVEKCIEYVYSHFNPIPIPNLSEELKADEEFLRRDVHSKCWEIAEHIKYVLNSILED